MADELETGYYWASYPGGDHLIVEYDGRTVWHHGMDDAEPLEESRFELVEYIPRPGEGDDDDG